MRILVVGMSGYTSVGESLTRGAHDLGHEVTFVDAAAAYDAPRWVGRLNWHLRDHRPPLLSHFERDLLARAADFRPNLVVATGQMPITAATLRALSHLGARTANVSTDDPWNRSSRSKRSLAALAAYDDVFTPRRSNLAQIQQLGGPTVHYLPFAYDPLHCVGPPLVEEDRARYACDLVFVGGADDDRAPLIRPVVESGLNVHLYGGKWERYPWARAAHRGEATPEVLRKATVGAAMSLCLLRRSNRDGHVMRTFEMAAGGACMLVEWSEEHEAILGTDGENVVYFRSVEEMMSQLSFLLGNEGRRSLLGARIAGRMADGHHTYKDRLAEIVDLSRPI